MSAADAAPLDPLDVDAIRAALPKGLGLTVVVHRVCASTNEAVYELAVPALCLAEMQTDGRGRRGTRWAQAPGGGLALSLAAPTPRGRLDPLAIALALAVAQHLRTTAYAEVQLKWPNDLYARDAKLGGLMIERDGAAPERLCVGLGLNAHAAPELPDRATIALAKIGPPPSRNRLAGELATVLLAALEKYDVEGFAPFAAEFSAFDWLAGRSIRLTDREETIAGVARGIDDSGALILETGAGRRLCRAGEVSPGSPAKESAWAGG
jgi:BirA family biotin operon repressor/biotin-[acetyl-CoA-carboxylase] ligase